MNILIVTGGKIDLDFALAFFENNKFDKIIAADKGIELLSKISVVPDYLVGDFDSVKPEVLEEILALPDNRPDKVIKYNSVKDFTDTEAAVQLAVELGADDITIIGATGTRMDHVLANINTLMIPLKTGISARIIDEHNNIRLIDKKLEMRRLECYSNTVSIIPYTDYVEGVSLKGFFYPLDNKTLSRFDEPSLGISNKLIEDIGVIELEKGILIVIEARD